MPHKSYNGKRNNIRVYCDESDLVYADSFLEFYKTRIIEKVYNGQYLTVFFETADWSAQDSSVLLFLIEEDLSRCIRRHKKPSVLPSALSKEPK